MRRRPTMLWVDPDFKRSIKMKAAETGCSIIELTRKMSNDDSYADMLNQKVKPKRQENGWQFRI